MSSATVRQRREARQLAVQALCVYDAVGDDFSPQLNTFLRDAQNAEDLALDAATVELRAGLARGLVDGVRDHRAECDQLLREHVKDWSVERMPPVDRNILRLGLYELRHRPQTPPEVVLNEAVELAKRFGGADSSAFVNGTLDGIRRKLASPDALE